MLISLCRNAVSAYRKRRGVGQGDVARHGDKLFMHMFAFSFAVAFSFVLSHTKCTYSKEFEPVST